MKISECQSGFPSFPFQPNPHKNCYAAMKARLMQILSPDSVITSSFRRTRPPGLSIRASSASSSALCCAVLPGTMPERITSKLDSLWAAEKKERGRWYNFTHTRTQLCLIHQFHLPSSSLMLVYNSNNWVDTSHRKHDQGVSLSLLYCQWVRVSSRCYCCSERWLTNQGRCQLTQQKHPLPLNETVKN